MHHIQWRARVPIMGTRYLFVASRHLILRGQYRARRHRRVVPGVHTELAQDRGDVMLDRTP